MTINQISETLQVDKNLTYGFMRFLKAIGAAETTPVKSVGRGKPTQQFRLTADYEAKLREYLSKVNS